MKVSFLGTNGWYSSPTGDTPCILLDTENHYIVLDAGNGIYKLDNYITEDKPISLFLSHFHLDHTSGLHILNKFDFKQGIDVYVGGRRKKDFETLVNPPFTVGYLPKVENIYNLKTTIRLHELSEDQKIPFSVVAIKQHHAYIDHGFRIKLDGKIIAYTGDCGFTDETHELAKDVDLLICECANKKTEESDKWGHFDPIQAGTLAKEAGAKQLILTHFGAHLYKTLQERKWAEDEAKRIFPNTLAAFDELEVKL
jgi:ribonuclease BN (tRNA processing enzyme)